ncbi:LysE family translocator [Bosea sp. PAMC 26642]|uniref:LysE family translocator n=1 Tax=Bosea sp. (strain PAMC 26642) TaxID=1792307 RepID=UPI00076FE931|nr:LysE family translocator [Bosea sp. PAMC 26642]AMJ61130.1 amino acid transporter [Bosea sp. PAMC 26642]
MLITLAPLVVFVATISPGGATALATASGANFGFLRSIPLLAGISVGLGTMAALAALGLVTLLLREPIMQTAMKAVGSGYLGWLAWRTARGGRPDLERNVAQPVGFLGGIGLLAINPKAWAMTLSAAASYAALAETPSQLALALGVVFVVLSSLSLMLWCAAGLVLGKLLRSDAHWRALNIVLGLLLVASIVPMWFE